MEEKLGRSTGTWQLLVGGCVRIISALATPSVVRKERKRYMYVGCIVKLTVTHHISRVSVTR